MRFSDVTQSLLASGRDPYLVYDARHDESFFAREGEAYGGRFTIMALDGAIAVVSKAAHHVTRLEQLTDPSVFLDESEAYEWCLAHTLALYPDSDWRAVAPESLSGRVRELAGLSSRRVSRFGQPLLWDEPLNSLARIARTTDGYELHHVGLWAQTHRLVARVDSLVDAEKLLLALRFRPERDPRWPQITFLAQHATADQISRITEARLDDVVLAARTPDGGGVLPVSRPIPRSVIPDDIFAASPGPVRAYGHEPTTYALGWNVAQDSYAIEERSTSPRFALIRFPERSNSRLPVESSDDLTQIHRLLRRLLRIDAQ